MNNLITKILLPLGVISAIATGFGSPSKTMKAERMIFNAQIEALTIHPDTVIYPANAYKMRWTEEDFRMQAGTIADSLLKDNDSLSWTFSSDPEQLPDSLDTTEETINPRDTIVAPDSLKDRDPFRYKYYAALINYTIRQQFRDSLLAAGDSLTWRQIDSISLADSLAIEKEKFDIWYAALSKTEKKKYDREQKSNALLEEKLKKQAEKDSIKAIKDSINLAKPRVLSTFALADSLQYKRLVKWTHEREFHKLNIMPVDTGFNYRFYDYPFRRNDVNATWLGVSGSPVQYYNYFKRESKDKVSFYEAQESWSYSASDMPMFNTKTPYTELGYFGTLFAGSEKESDNLHLLTSQNISPELNYTLSFDRFGGGGMLANEQTANKTTMAGMNYLGERYLAHAGIISNTVNRQENGGIQDNFWIRDTTVNAREIDVTLSDASSKVKKRTLFLDQQYSIPFDISSKKRRIKAVRLIKKAYKDSVLTSGGTVDKDVMNDYASRMANRILFTSDKPSSSAAFIGHSTEYSVYSRIYTDKVSSSNKTADAFYNGNHYLNPTQTQDSMRVSRLENKAFIRLQPWSDESIVSKLNLGVGERSLNYYKVDPTFTRKNNNVTWNSAYVYAGAEGKMRNYIDWDAKGEYVFAGKELNDLNIDARMGFNIYPFRKARTSPVALELKFNSSLDEPEFYQQHMMSNHYKWDNEFDKISTTRIQGQLSVPRWKISADMGYALLSGNLYYDTDGIIRQNNDAMSVISANIKKEFVINDFIHLDNNALFQFSSNEDVLPLPAIALNLKYYVQFNISNGVLLTQLGVNGYYNSKWYSPSWNPALGVFHNQTEQKYNNGPFFDLFANMQWKRAVFFVKYLNAGQGWPMDHNDYFTANHYINSQKVIKLGIYWPFYTQPIR